MKNKLKAERKKYTTQFYQKNYITFLIALFATLLTAALNLWIAWVMQQMIDSISGVPGSLNLSVLSWCVAEVIVAIIMLKGISYYSKPRFMKIAMTQYKDFAFHKLTKKSISTFNVENTANYISAFSNDATTIENGYLEMQFNILANAITLIGALVMMIAYSPIMTIVACLFFVLPIGVSYITGNRIEKAERTISEKNSELVATLKDSLSGFSVIKSFKAENAISGLFTKSNTAVEQAKCNKRKLVTIISGLAGVAGVTAQLGTFLVGAFLALSGWGITPGILIVFIDLTANVINPIRELPEQLASKKAAIALIDKLADSLEGNVREEGTHIPKQLGNGITLKNVTFGYEANCNILHDINTTFGAGKKYAIVGASGSGKSTLLNLLMASHGNYCGEICYDGYEVKDISSESLYDIVSMIQQNVFVFNASIRDNITMFHEFPKSEVDRAIELSGLSKLIADRGEDYLCGENGSGLSGGEKQRISIARSLLKKSQVLLVDEATAALDAETAYQVSNAILSLNDITSIVVTHSLDEGLLRQYDGIITLKNGSIVETGTFDELIAGKGYFYSLFTISQ
ncbi:MAG: ABC transporter ATP-binding protein [Lachnospiraceae bacterium]|nr:ABC transporter ATP-binding protein [Lachnospiraceae bacterium]